MVLAFLTLLTGLAISAVAIYYSVIGLAAIFSAAVIPIIVMGAILEVSKLVAAWWLKANWDRAPVLLKSYMLISVVILMLITSMGIFGFLSKAHSDQAITTGDVQAQVYLIDEQIKIERENIANAQSLIKQLDDAVVGINASGVDREIRLRDGTTRTQSAAERALQVRRSQAKDRANLTSQIEEAQQKIIELQQKKAPIAANMREVEAKVGPIKYIAQLIYGEEPDQNLLEKAVTWVIITIVFVFDPLAVLLLLASQMSFQWARKEKERTDELVQETTTPEDRREEIPPSIEPVIGAVDEGNRGEQPETERIPDPDEGNKKIDEIEREVEEIHIQEEPKNATTDDNNNDASSVGESVDIRQDRHSTVLESNIVNEPEDIDDEDIESKVEGIEKRAIHRWKKENPEGNIKRSRRLLEEGFITELPWQKFIDEEHKKIVDPYVEIDNSTRAKPDLTEVIDNTGYIQNSEQGDNTIWKKIQDTKK